MLSGSPFHARGIAGGQPVAALWVDQESDAVLHVGAGLRRVRVAEQVGRRRAARLRAGERCV
jgi:hypothetical protein